MDKASRDDVAVFVDFENVYVSVREKFDATPNFELIMDRCEDYGRIVIARAYADWYRYPRVTSALFANGVEPMYVPTYYYDRDLGRTGRPIKNSVDIHLCIDAMRTLYTEPNIRKFVLVTGDRDFIPLVNAIRQRGKDVIIIGIGGAASAHLAQSADEFLFYEQIADLKSPQQADESRRVEEARRTEEPRRAEERREAPERTQRSRPERAPKPEPVAAPETRTNGQPVVEPAAIEPALVAPTMVEPAATERNPFDTLVDAINLARQRGFVVNLGSLKVVMRELDSGFHESKVKDSNGRGFGKFKDFVKEAERQGKVQIFTNGTVTEIFLPGEDPYKLSVFSEDLASERAERELETELAQEVETHEAQPSTAGHTPNASEAAPPEEAPAAEQATSDAGMAAEAETPGETVRHIFADREWDVFRSSMSQFTEPVRFAEIFNALRGLRNQEVVELTNNELKELVKQAINRGMLQRTGRGARAYYRLSTQYRIARSDAAGDQEVDLVVPEAVPFSSTTDQSGPDDALNADVPPTTPTSRRRARHYGVPSVDAPVDVAQPAEVSSDPEALATESGPGTIVDTVVVPGGPTDGAEDSPQVPEAPARKPSRSRRKPANARPAEPEAVVPAQAMEQPAAPSRSKSQRSRKRPTAEAEGATMGDTPPTTRGARRPAQVRTKASEAPVPEEAPAGAAKKRRKRPPTSTPNDAQSEG